MKLKCAEIREFRDNSSGIKHNSVLPILEFLKFDKGTITKNNLKSFYIQKIDCDKQFLIEEKRLYSFVSETTVDEIELTFDKNGIILDNGERKFRCPTADFKTFPVSPDPETKAVEITSEQLAAIASANNYIIDDDFEPAKSHVFCKNNWVCGSDGLIGFGKKFDSLPTMALRKDAAQAITKFSSLTFSEDERYMFFKSGKSTYGFVKSDIPPMDLSPWFNVPKVGSQFIADKSRIVSFNNLSISNGATKNVVPSNMTVVDGVLQLRRVDPDYELNLVEDVPVSGTDIPVFHFNSFLLNRLLKSISDNEVTFVRDDKRYFIYGDSGFVSIIQGLAYQNN